jgi:hypothetical protein
MILYSVEFNELDEMIHDAIGSHNSFVTQKGCEIVWRGRVAYKSAEMAKNRATKLFFAAVAWGSEVIDPTTTEPMLLQSQAK